MGRTLVTDLWGIRYSICRTTDLWYRHSKGPTRNAQNRVQKVLPRRNLRRAILPP